MNLWIGLVTYGTAEREWLDRVGKHYLQNAPPGAFFAVGVQQAVDGLCGEVIGQGPLLGLCLVGRPEARRLPQDGTTMEVTRLVLVPGLPHGTASAVLRVAARYAAHARAVSLIAYHDRTRHTGCVYKKAGFKRDGTTRPAAGKGWGSRLGRTSAAYAPTSKRRWRLALPASVGGLGGAL